MKKLLTLSLLLLTLGCKKDPQFQVGDKVMFAKGVYDDAVIKATKPLTIVSDITNPPIDGKKLTSWEYHCVGANGVDKYVWSVSLVIWDGSTGTMEDPDKK